MGNKIKNAVERVFIWRFRKKSEAREFERFQLTCVAVGLAPTFVMMEAIKAFNVANKPEYTPVSEGNAIEALHRLGYKSTRQWLKGLRDSGELDNLWSTDGKSIVYNKEGLLKFVRARYNGNGRRGK